MNQQSSEANKASIWVSEWVHLSICSAPQHLAQQIHVALSDLCTVGIQFNNQKAYEIKCSTVTPVIKYCLEMILYLNQGHIVQLKRLKMCCPFQLPMPSKLIQPIGWVQLKLVTYSAGLQQCMLDLTQWMFALWEKVQHALPLASTVNHCLNPNTAEQPFWKCLSWCALVVEQFPVGRKS